MHFVTNAKDKDFRVVRQVWLYEMKQSYFIVHCYEPVSMASECPVRSLPDGGLSDRKMQASGEHRAARLGLLHVCLGLGLFLARCPLRMFL